MAFAILGLFGLLEIVGPCVWDPVELDLAELGREGRGAPPELAFVARAIGAAFRMLGVSGWAGRLPMMLLGLAGAFAAFAFARRFGEKHAGPFALAVLATAPAYVLPSRVIGTAIVPISTTLIAFVALSIVTFGAARRGPRLALLFLAILAAAVSSSSSGMLVSVAVPAGAVGLAALVHARSRALGAGLVLLATVIGGLSVFAALHSSAGSERGLGVLMLGAEHAAHKTPSFEATWARLATSLFPWSALLPVALAFLGRRSPRDREPAARTALGAWLLFALFAQGLLAQRDPGVPFVALGGLGVVLGMALAELDVRAASPWSGRVLSALTLVVIAWLACDDVTRAPAKALLALTTRTDVAVPAAMEKEVVRAFRGAALVLVVLSLLPVAAQAMGNALAKLPLRVVSRVPASVLGGLRAVSARPGVLVLAGGAAAGLLLRARLYPEMLRSFAPDTALAVYGEKAHEGERLGLFGINGRTLAYVHNAPSSPVKIASAAEAVTLLTPAASSERRDFVALAQKDLGQVNALYRGQRGRNLQILGRAADRHVGSDAVLLATSALRPGERSQNPLDEWLLSDPPTMSRPFAADLGGKLEPIGWDLTRDDGRPLDHVAPRSSFHVKIALRVTVAPGAGYCTFIHLEHAPTRTTAEHKDFAQYPMGLWQKGDIVLDDFEVTLPPQFAPGRYSLFYGVGVLPCEDDKRLAVVRGRSDGHDRALAGDVEVR
jgi:hypothetical protein